MIVPKLLSLSSSDLAAGELPPDPAHCLVPMLATIGPSSGTVGDGFSFTVVTPSALAESGRFGWGRGTLIIDSFSWSQVEHSVNRLLAHASRPSWQDVAQVLNHELLWEFDGYRQS
ncbi:hypothetical protein IB230_16550 [Pseudoxanthomonas sp. PXM01]|nr:hypothetical protein [Pseudoxanthomonas sp. PXM01]